MKEETPTPAQTQRLASLGFMVASVCHEVSNPLAAVSSMLQILQSKRGVTPETIKTRVKRIFIKLSAESRAQAVVRAQSLGLLRDIDVN